MRRKKILKFIATWVHKPIVKLFFYISGLVLVLFLSGAAENDKGVLAAFFDAFYNLFVSEGTLSIFFAGLVSLGLAKIFSHFEYYMEETMKVEDDHHKIIRQYHKHKTEGDAASKRNITLPMQDANAFSDKDGVYMDLYCVKQDQRMEAPGEMPRVDASATGATLRAQRKALRAWKAKNRKWERRIDQLDNVKDAFSKDAERSRAAAIAYLGGRVRLCSLNVFTNISGNTKVCFQDSSKEAGLPDFVISHGDELLQAHKNSTKSNSNTVRLNDFTYENGVLTLDTARSTYYHMLITNRCMDYKFANGLSIRELYEYNTKVRPLADSKFGNQIGINGLVITSGPTSHVLLEKRSRKKILWKNKFAQSISLALKTEDLKLSQGEILSGDIQTASDKIANVIYKTLEGNFGLKKEDFIPFEMEKNFLGIARDLLEGGKPNLYFYLQTKADAEELKKKLEENVRITPKDNVGKPEAQKRQVISSSKLDSDYYLVPRKAIEIDYNYRLYVNRQNSLKIHRKLHPRCTRITQWWDSVQENFARVFKPVLKRECGEALLATLAFFRLCGNRLPFGNDDLEDQHG